MNLECFRIAISAAFAAALVPAQTWAVTANAPVPGSSSVTQWIASGNVSSSASLPVGPRPPGAMLTCGIGVIANASGSWSASVPGQVGPVAASVRMRCTANGSYNYSSMATMDVTLDLLFTAPSPSSGRLLLESLPLGVGGGIASLDVDADGTIDWSVSLPASSAAVDLPFTIPAAGRVVRVHGNLGAMGMQFFGGLGDITLQLEFLPGQPVVAPFAPGNATLAFDHSPTDLLTLTLPSYLGITPLLIVLGSAPTQVPILPQVTQLVTLDVVVAAPSLTFALPPLPPGTAVYAQGLVIVPPGDLVSTGSLRMLWP